MGSDSEQVGAVVVQLPNARDNATVSLMSSLSLLSRLTTGAVQVQYRIVIRLPTIDHMTEQEEVGREVVHCSINQRDQIDGRRGVPPNLHRIDQWRSGHQSGQ